MIKRPFSKALYEAYDSPARNALSSYLKGKGHTIISNKEDYSFDVVSQKDDFTYLNEVEVKTAWKGDWPDHWTEIRIPGRKQRLLDKHTKEANNVINFYVFRPDFKQAWRIKDTLLTKESLGEASGRYIRPGELFFHIPFKAAELVVV